MRASKSTRISLSIAATLFCFSCAARAGPPARNECAHPPPGAIFCEDFESQDPKANFNDYDGNLDSENLVVTQSGPAGDAENRAIRLRVPAGQSGTSDLLKVFPQAYDKLYARWYLRYEAGFDFAARNHGSGLAAGDRDFVGVSGNRPQGTDFAGFYIQYQEQTSRPYAYSYYRGMYQDCPAAGSCFGDSLPCVYDSGGVYCTNAQHRPSVALPTFRADQWYCIEEMVDLGAPTTTGIAPNGQLTLWVDAQQIGDFHDLWLRTTPALKLQTLWLSLFHHDGNHSIAGELIDNVVVSTERIGCGTANTIPPPTNLRVIGR
jgi:hypothetical protein